MRAVGWYCLRAAVAVMVGTGFYAILCSAYVALLEWQETVVARTQHGAILCCFCSGLIVAWTVGRSSAKDLGLGERSARLVRIAAMIAVAVCGGYMIIALLLAVVCASWYGDFL